ncbi:MAG: hypothetical protein WCK94_09965 [Comamonadaceae bacterium]
MSLSAYPRFVSVILAWMLLAASVGTLAQTRPAVTRLDPDSARSFLWVGNSFFYYNNSMHGHVGAMSAAAGQGPALRGTSVTISGSGLDWHDIASYLRPDGIGRYSFVGNNDIQFNKPGRQFDAVIMMDCSQCPIHPQLKSAFHDTVKKDAEILSGQGIQAVLFMSWAYKDKPEMTQQLAEQYTLAGNANRALVIPAGLAFSRAIAARPGLELYQPDLRHPSLAGTYLAAATVLGAITGKSPVGNSYTAGLDVDLARFLQQTAWDTLQSYYGR